MSELIKGDYPMHDMQARPSNTGQSQRFPRSNSGKHRTDGTTLWPTQSGDRLHALVKRRRRALSNRSEVYEQSSKVGYHFQRRTTLQQFFPSFSLERSFTLFSFAVAVILISLFGLDLACAWPFRRASLLFDFTSTLCGAVLLLLCWDVFWEQAKGLTR